MTRDMCNWIEEQQFDCQSYIFLNIVHMQCSSYCLLMIDQDYYKRHKNLSQRIQQIFDQVQFSVYIDIQLPIHIVFYLLFEKHNHFL
eukprot:UN12077